MKVTGIITEYNPLHSGHKYHIEQSRLTSNAEAIVCVMSGSFMQRGIPALIDKWNRTLMALKNGVDLVIELPVLYSLSSAEFFGYGAVSLLNSMGVINNICFGSEFGNISLLKNIAEILSEEPLAYKILLKKYLNQNLSFPKCRSLALKEFLGEIELNDSELDSMLNSSNNILGIEYCKSLYKLKSQITPSTIKRIGSDYNSIDIDSDFSSATAIRKHLKERNELHYLRTKFPIATLDILDKLEKENYQYVFEDSMFSYLKYKVLSEGKTLEHIPDASEGLNNRIVQSVEKSNNYYQILENAKSKRYAYTRISRILCQYFVGFEEYDTSFLREESCPYGRILGFNSTGAKILKEAKIHASIPLYTKLPNSKNEVLNLDLQATKVYSLLNKQVAYNDDFLISPIILDKK